MVTKDENFELKTYNSTTIIQLGRYNKVKKHNREKLCIFFVVPGNGQALPGLPDFETLDILTTNCNIIDTKEADKAGNHKTNTSQLSGVNKTKTIHQH